MSVERIVRVFVLFGAMAVTGTWLLVAQDASRVGDDGAGNARPVPVAPMDPGGSALITQRCPGFSWSAVPEASGYELVVYRAETSALDSTAPVIRVRLPRGSSWWSPSSGQCLEAGSEYAWVVRALGGTDVRWSEPTLFSIEGPSPDELAAALELVAAHLGVTVGSVASVETSDGRAIGRVQPGESLGNELSPPIGASIVVTRTAAIDAELPDGSGPALGVIGTTHSPGGAGVGGNSTAADGVGGYFTNSGGGDLLAAGNSGLPTDRVFRVDNSGNVVAPSFSGDGSGVSGVDADLLDGTDSTGFFVLSEDETVVGTPTFSTNFNVGSTTLIPDLNADLLDGLSSTEFAASSHDHAGEDWPTVDTTYGLRVDNSGTYALFGGGGSHGVYGSGSSYGLYGAGGGTGVLGSGTTYGVYGISSDFAGVFGDGGSDSGDYGGYFTGYSGVFGNAENAAGYGIHGNNSGAGYGVYGVSVAGDGVRGDGGSASGDYGGHFVGGSGVYAAGNSSGGRGILAFNQSETFAIGTISAYNNASAGSPTGIFVSTQAGDDNAGWGVVADSDYIGLHGRAFRSGGFHAGVWGYVTDSSGYGIFSTGNMYGTSNLTVVGTVSKGGGSFKIDHPLEPESKYLYHSFVESPDMMNVYNGNVILDAKGSAWVELPGYFEALNMDFRYQLTAIGTPAPRLHVATEIVDNRFQVAGGEPGMQVSWMVTGVRNDPWARANRIPVEEDKPIEEQGLFLHPQAYGLPAEASVTQRLAPPPPEMSEFPRPEPEIRNDR